MTAQASQRKALILSPNESASQANDHVRKLRSDIHAVRIYNLTEYLSLQGWDYSVSDMRATHKEGFNRLIWTKRTEWPQALDAEQEAQRLRAAFTFDEDQLDWSDIDSFTLDADADVTHLSDPAGRSDRGVLDRIVAARPTEVSVSVRPGEDAEHPHQETAVLPVVIGSGLALRALWIDDGRLESEPIDSWEDVETTVTDPDSSFAVSADGRLVVVAHHGVIRASSLTRTMETVPTLLGQAGEVTLPESLGHNPRIVTTARMRTGTIRMTIATDTGGSRLFLAPDGEISQEPVLSIPAGVRIGIDVPSGMVLFRTDGRQLRLGGGQTILGGLRKVRMIDAAFSGGVTVVAALGERSKQTTVEVTRRRGTSGWEPVDITEHGVDARSISSVTVERRLDDVEPSHVVVAAGETTHVIALSRRAHRGSAHEFGGIPL